jgi:hypothetical protein
MTERVLLCSGLSNRANLIGHLAANQPLNKELIIIIIIIIIIVNININYNKVTIQ